MKRVIGFLILVLASCSSIYGQTSGGGGGGQVGGGNVTVQGTVVANDCVKFVSPNVITDAGLACGGGSGGTPPFSAITAGTNPNPLVIGSGGSLTVSGTGIIGATAIDGVTVTGTPTSGQVPTATSGTAATWQTPATGGTVTSFSAGNLSPLLTSSVATSTTTPALSFTLSNAGAFTLFGNNTSSSAAPSYTTMGSIFGSCSGATNALTFNTTTNAFGCNTISGGGSGTVTSFSSGNLSPLLTTSVATATTTPAQTFALSNAAPFTDFSNATSSSAAPTYNLVSALNGANVDAQTGNYSFTCATDRDGEIDFNISAAATLTMPQAGSTSCLLGNFFVYVRNTASSTAVLTVTATTSTFQPEGGASHTVLPNSSLIIFSDATSSTGNYHAILTPASFGGVNTKTSSYTATAADANKLIVANCSGACAITLPATPPNSGWTTQVISIGSTLATVGLNSLNFNGSATAPVLVSKETLSVFTDGTNYFGNVPASAGTGTVTSVTCGTGLTGGTITTTGTCAVGGAVGEILAGATPALTATPTLGASGMAGTLAMFPASGNFTTTWGSAATTSNTILGFAAVPVTGDTVTCTVSSTTCTLTDSGLPPFNPAVPGAIGGTTPAAGTFTTLTGKTSVTAGIVGTTAGLINLSGLTSGTATITAPAVAGTVTNPILFSNGIAVNTGSTASTSCPGISLYGSCSGLGFNYLSSGSGGIAIVAGSANVAEVMSAANAGFQLPTGSIYSWGSLAGAAGDTGISRGAAGIVDVGNGTNANTTGILKAAAYMSLGTKYTATGCSNGTTVGGATSGQFASGTTGTCTVVVTMGNTATAPNGWSCWANNLTTTTDLWAETATTTTTATIAGTSVTGDTINFGCMAY